MKLNKKIIAAMLAISMVTVTAENNVMMAEAASKPSVTKNLTITEGKKKTITVKGSFIKSKSFKSTNKSIAVVNKKGVVTAVSKGKCKVKVTVKYTKSKKAKKVLKKVFTTNVTVKAKKKPEATKTPEVTQNPSEQPTSAPETTPGTEGTTAPSSSAPEGTPSVQTSAPEATNAPTTKPEATNAPTATPKATANPGVTVKPETPGSSQIYYPINKPSVNNTPKPTPTQTPDTPAGDVVEDVVIDMTKVGETTFTESSSPSAINFKSQIEKRFDMKYFSEMKVGYTLEFVEGGDTGLLDCGKISVVDSEEKLNGKDDGVALTYDMKAGKDMVSISLTKDGKKVEGPVVGINIQPMDSNASYSWPASLKSVTINSIVFVAKEGATYPAEPTTPPTQGPELGDVEIDMTKVGETNFTTKQNVINFSNCLPAGFDLSCFEEVEVGYELNINEGTELDLAGKISLAADEGTLNGWDKGIAESFNVSPGNNKLTISLYNKQNEKLEGTAVGINIQLSNKAWNGDPKFESIKITSIKFIAKKGAQEPTEPTPTPPTTEPTPTPPTTEPTPPTQTTEPTTGSAVEDVTIDLKELTEENVTSLIQLADGSYQNPKVDLTNGVKFAGTMNTINFTDLLPEVFDLKYFEKLKVDYIIDPEEGDWFSYGKIALVNAENKLNGYDDGVVKGSVTIGQNFTEFDLHSASKELTGSATGINIQVGAKDQDKFKSITVTSIKFIAKADAIYGQ